MKDFTRNRRILTLSHIGHLSACLDLPSTLISAKTLKILKNLKFFAAKSLDVHI